MFRYHAYVFENTVNSALNDIQRTTEFKTLYPDSDIFGRQLIRKQVSGPQEQNRYKRYIVISGVYCINNNKIF
jgi:hypothetical protein